MRLEIDGEAIEAPLDREAFDYPRGWHDEAALLFERGEVYRVALPEVEIGAASASSSGALTSPMPGRIVSVSADPGARVVKGQPIVALEAMKMEHALLAPFDGKLVELNVKVGDQVVEGATLARVEAD